MTDEHRRSVLTSLLKRPLRDWESACGVQRPPDWLFWEWTNFLLCVAVTRQAIAATLREECYDRSPPCVPYVEVIEIEDGMITLHVHTWGRPWEK